MKTIIPITVAVVVCLTALCCTASIGEQFGNARFASIDNHAKASPKQAEKSVRSLASYLAEPAADDLERARAVYAWIVRNVEYDPGSSKDYEDQRPECVLKTRRAACCGYATLFKALAEQVGLQAEIIEGFSRGKGYTAGSRVEKKDHAWNAVKIGDKWGLIDCAWGAGYLNSDDRFVRKPSDHYFLTPPEQFIFDHFPEEPEWQLLDKPITRDEYERLVYLKPAFFRNHLRLSGHSVGIIKGGCSCEIEMESPDDVLLNAQVIKGEVKTESASVLVQKQEEQTRVSAVVPESGEYVLRIFAKHKSDPGLYEWAADYLIQAQSPPGKNESLPKALETFHEKNARLYAPMTGSLKSGSVEKFSISAPGALSVAVIVDGSWVSLKKNGEVFEGEVVVKGSEVKLAAQFAESDRYFVLLKVLRLVMQPGDVVVSAVGVGRDLWSGLLDLIYPPFCTVCGKADDSHLCAKCAESIDIIGDQYCRKCAMPGEHYHCVNCRDREFAFDSACSAALYDGPLRKAIHALKYDNRIAVADPLSDLMVRCFPHAQFSGRVDVLIPIPIHRSRMLERGFNQAVELSRRMSSRFSLPLEPRVLYKVKNTRHQANLPQDQRAVNLEGAFAARNPDRIQGKRVLLVDDVITTGCTMNEAAKVLKAAGARSVHAYALARSV